MTEATQPHQGKTSQGLPLVRLDGVTKEFFESTLQPLGFDVRVHPHNHRIGAEALAGELGRAQWKYRMGHVLSGRDPASPASALSLMCIARRTAGEEPEAG